ncbi:hypothetical protein NOR51B_1829 [Luminiphilus syltensis NOR5-1B]|uniref:Inner membrane protein YgaP-like transmembrane domain-containing protein n=1 Tax=Luminiphilus syltensis NOR5-1B TaxID=565045 RepID=B8KTS2_9GAMM|nr:hypothetical protein NOR51B_1829 [Luminiphilus syltensis NOR5-1B]
MTGSIMQQNLGTFERGVRLSAGILFITYSAIQETFGLIEGLSAFVGVLLILNGISGRCYLWRWLGLKSCQCDSGGVSDQSDGGSSSK